MAYQNFIPTIWNEAINRELERTLVFAENCNRQYEGDVKTKGDSVRILGIGKPTITTTTDKNIILDDAETVEDKYQTLTIQQIAHFNYKIDDIDKRQAVGGVMEALSAETSHALANVMDKYIADLAKHDDAVLFKADAPVQITEANILTTVDEVLQRLYENDVTPGTGITLTVPPWFYMMMKRAYTDLDTRNSEMVKNGKVGMYAGATVKMSNNVAVGANDASLIQVKTNKAIAFVNPMTHTEPYRPEKGFSDAVKGFVLYDAKIVRPKEMIILNCTH